jgi:hypothetical protein
MNTLKAVTFALVAASAFAGSAQSAASGGFSLDVVLDGSVRPEYRTRGAVYVKAVRGRPYRLRVTNPLPVRVAVALSVDGLNTLDASHSDARSAPKWVLGPYETLEVPGWQVNGSNARRFVFTGERSSYGAWLGATDNLGVIEAVFYREKACPIRVAPVWPDERDSRRGCNAPAPGEAHGGDAGASAEGVPGAARSEKGTAAPEGSAQAKDKLRDEYAATGIGERTRHDVESVRLELEEKPAASVRIRYEFREQLVRLGVLPATPDPLARREGARGFDGRYCPDPAGGR